MMSEKNISEDIVDASILLVGSQNPAAKKENVLDRLNKRNKDRQNYLETKNEQRHKYGLQLEGADYFSEMFNEKVHEINIRIQNVSDTAAKKTNADNVNPDLRRIFADITMEIQDLEKYLTKSTMFLTDYKIKTCQNILNDLSNANDEARLKLIPKKKFGFSGKKTKAANHLVEGGASAKTEKNNPNSEDGNRGDDLLKQSKKQIKANLDTTDLNKSKNRIGNYFDSEATLHNRQDEYICLTDAEISNKDITISSMENCFIEIQGHLGSLQLHNLKDCIVLCGPVSRACFAQFCENTILTVACQQLRLHTSNSIQLFLHVTCRAVIEESRKIQVAPYNYDYPTINSDFEASGLDRSLNKYDDIADFDWLSPDIPSPNWNMLKPDPEISSCTWQEMRSKFLEKSSFHASK